MSNLLPMLPGFVTWYFLYTPRRLFKLARVFILTVNNSLAFTLNLRLFFTPLYGDYTIIGRIMGFTVRIVQVFFGFIFLFLILSLIFILPVGWFVLPGALFYIEKPLIFLYFAAVPLYYYVTSKDRASRMVKEVKDDNVRSAFRPRTRTYYNRSVETSSIPQVLLYDKSVVKLMRRTELYNEEFINKLLNTKIDMHTLDKAAFDYARSHDSRYVEVEHLFLGALSLIQKIDLALATYGSSVKDIEDTARWIICEKEKLAKIYFWQEDYELPKMGGVGRGLTGRVTPKLDSVSQDFTKLAQKGIIQNIVAHEDKMAQVMEYLGSKNRNVLLIGPPGCGKTSVVKGVAERIVRGTDVGAVKFKRVVSIDTASLIAGSKSVGDIAERFKGVMEEIKSSGDIILFFDEIHNLVASMEGDNAATVFSVLEPHLANGHIQFIGATNLENYRKYLEPSGSFATLFEVIEIPEASEEDTLNVLTTVTKQHEKEYGIFITYPALKTIVELSKKLIHERVFPDKALDILNRVSISVANNTKVVDTEAVRKEISDFTHVPVTSLSEDESQKLLSIENELKQRVIGQDLAVSQVSKALRRARVGIRNEGKPIASFLFVGTTGVGKTETAKALADKYFGSEKNMIRLDMSEYQQQDSINRLIGEPGGRSKGILTEAVRTSPYTLVLLDEIEKAYSNILLTFLQVMDDGRLTDSSGLTVDFSNTIIIATSNVGTRAIQEVVERGGGFEEVSEVAMREVRGHYAPEFLNRFSGIIVFKPLSTDVVRRITYLSLEGVKKLADGKGIKLNFKPELVDELMNRGYNKEWGARPLKRLVEDSVESYLAMKILAKEFRQGDEVTIGPEVFEEQDVTD